MISAVMRGNEPFDQAVQSLTEEGYKFKILNLLNCTICVVQTNSLISTADLVFAYAVCCFSGVQPHMINRNDH